MTLEERWQKANEEYRALIKWEMNEIEKVWRKMDAEGILSGLDTNREAYAPIHEEFNRRTLALFDKYNLPNKPTGVFKMEATMNEEIGRSGQKRYGGMSWNVQAVSNAKLDVKAAEFVESCLYDMQSTWTDTVSEILSFLTYGWSIHEIVYKRRMGHKKDPRLDSQFDDGLIGWQKLPIRSQESLYEWEFDEHDNLICANARAEFQENPNPR